MYSSLRKILFYLIVAMAIGMIILAFVRNVPVAKIATIDDSEFDTMGIEFPSFQSIYGISLLLVGDKRESSIELNTLLLNILVVADDVIVYNYDILGSDVSLISDAKNSDEVKMAVDETILKDLLCKLKKAKTKSRVLFSFHTYHANIVKEINLSAFGMSCDYKEFRKIKKLKNKYLSSIKTQNMLEPSKTKNVSK